MVIRNTKNLVVSNAEGVRQSLYDELISQGMPEYEAMSLAANYIARSGVKWSKYLTLDQISKYLVPENIGNVENVEDKKEVINNDTIEDLNQEEVTTNVESVDSLVDNIINNLDYGI